MNKNHEPQSPSFYTRGFISPNNKSSDAKFFMWLFVIGSNKNSLNGIGRLM